MKAKRRMGMWLGQTERIRRHVLHKYFTTNTKAYYNETTNIGSDEFNLVTMYLFLSSPCLCYQ
jgi:hypothetical protein